MENSYFAFRQVARVARPAAIFRLWLLALLLPWAAQAQTPTVTVTPAGPLTLCPGSTQTLTATATVSAGLAYTWSNGATGPSITVSQPGDYQATATTANGTGYSNVVRVNAAPAVSVQVTPTGPVNLLNGGSQVLTATTTTAGFNVGGVGFDLNVYSLAEQPDGKVLVSGGFTSYNNNAAAPHGLARLNADGSLDTNFNNGGTGFNSNAGAIAIQPDGKLLVASYSATYNNLPIPAGIVRLNADGSLDNSFNPGGVGFNDIVRAIAIQPDGKILVGGIFTRFNNAPVSSYLVRLRRDGTLDTDFLQGSGFFEPNGNGGVFTLAVQATDNKIIVGGKFTAYSGLLIPRALVRLNTNGSLDTSFNPNGGGFSAPLTTAVQSVAVQADGKVVVGGLFTSYNNNSTAPRLLLRLNPDGSLDTSFNAGGVGFSTAITDYVVSIALDASGKIVAGGVFSSYNGNATPNNIARINGNGSLDTTFNPGGSGFNSTVLKVVTLGDGKMLVGGGFTSYNGSSSPPFWLVRLNANGSINNTATPLAGVTFVYNPGATSGATRSVSTAGTYTATATDPATGCTYLSNPVVVSTPLPALSSLSPTSGLVGSSVTLTGSFLDGATAVTFAGSSNNVVTTGLTVSGTGSSQIITVSVPTGAATGNVTVTTPNGTSNGVAFTVTTAPTVTTAAPASITSTSAALGGTVTADGGNAVTERGVVYSITNTTPTTADTKAANGTGTGSFAATISSLTPGTTYYVRAYAINNAGTSYGSGVSYTTTPNAPVVTAPANGSLVNTTTTPTYAGTAVAGSTVMVYVDGTAIGTTTATAGGNFSLTQPTALSQGSHTVYATAQTSGSAVSANSTPNTFTVDTVRPSATISSTAGASGSTTATTPIPFTVTFSESVTGFTASGVTVTNGTVSGFAGSGTTYSFTVAPTTAGTATTVNVAANAAQNSAGNGNTVASQYSLTYTAPVTVTVWTGSVSTDWFTAGNWTTGVPITTLDATIPAGAPRYPVLTANTALAKTLTLASGGSLTHTGGTLNLSGDLVNNGTYTGFNATTGGTVLLSGTAAHALSGSTPLSFYNLTVGAGGATQAVAVDLVSVLALTGNLTTNGNALTLLSSARGDALLDNSFGGVVNGTARVQRYIDPSLNAGPGYRHYSAPVSNSTVGDLATSGFTPVVNSTYNTSPTPSLVTPFPTVFGYDQARMTVTNNYAPFDKGFFSPVALSDPLIVGRGYTVNLGANELVDFTGTLNNGPITQTLASNRNVFLDGGWHLVGNPYPAPLDYSLIPSADRMGLEGAIYVFRSTSQYNGQYRAFVNGIGGNPVIPSGQGFFARVAVGVASGSLTFRNSQRLTAPSGTTFQRHTAETRSLVQLTLRGATGMASDDAYLYAEAGATTGFDVQYDAVKLPNSTGLNLSSTAAGQELAINGLPVFASGTVVPLSVGVPAAGAYTLRVAQLLNLPAGTAAVLVDAQLGTQTDLAALPAAGYAFAVSPAQASALVQGRFFLNLVPAGAPLATAGGRAAATLALFPNPTTSRAATLTGAAAGAKVTVCDALGRAVLTSTASGVGTALLALPEGTATGVYVVRTGAQALRLVVE